ncbi:MAG: hypothetical protein WCI95_09235 [bacterium]
MHPIQKWFAMLLASVALLAPIAATSACGEAHEEACADECACICHCLPPYNLHENTTELFAPVSKRTVPSDHQQYGILLVADIFRPPLSV